MKTLNELTTDLKAYIIELQSDAHNKGNLRPERYNNMKMVMTISNNQSAHIEIFIGMSSADFNLRTGEKITGGLGPDERYVLRWLEKPTSIPALMENWRQLERNRGRATDK